MVWVYGSIRNEPRKWRSMEAEWKNMSELVLRHTWEFQNWLRKVSKCCGPFEMYGCSSSVIYKQNGCFINETQWNNDCVFVFVSDFVEISQELNFRMVASRCKLEGGSSQQITQPSDLLWQPSILIRIWTSIEMYYNQTGSLSIWFKRYEEQPLGN